MRVGSIVFATDQGLGYLAKSFYDNGVVTDVLLMRHKKRFNHHEWYPKSQCLSGKHNWKDIGMAKRFAEDMDVMLFFETPFYWELLPHCHQRGIRTVLMPMYECTPDVLPASPDKFICPSLLDLKYFPDGVFIPVPVDVEWHQRTRARVFVHNAGNLGLNGRNGTGTLIDAMRYVKSDAKLLLRSQTPLPWDVDNPRIEVQVRNVPHNMLWCSGDVFVFPERFNGLSLPLQEARAAGMLVISTDRFPVNTWLPKDGLVQVSDTRRDRVAPRRVEYEESLVSPEDLATMIDRWYDADITRYSLEGKEWAEDNSWEKLKPIYIKELESS